MLIKKKILIHQKKFFNNLKNKKYGLGHYKRSLIKRREILESLSSAKNYFSK